MAPTEPAYSIVLTDRQLGLVLVALQERPYKEVHEIVVRIAAQVRDQQFGTPTPESPEKEEPPS